MAAENIVPPFALFPLSQNIVFSIAFEGFIPRLLFPFATSIVFRFIVFVFCYHYEILCSKKLLIHFRVNKSTCCVCFWSLFGQSGKIHVLIFSCLPQCSSRHVAVDNYYSVMFQFHFSSTCSLLFQVCSRQTKLAVCLLFVW